MRLKEIDLREIELRPGFAGAIGPGYFHQWCSEPFFVGDLNQTVFPRTFALVELTDGTVHLVEPKRLRFTDRTGKNK